MTSLSMIMALAAVQASLLPVTCVKVCSIFVHNNHQHLYLQVVPGLWRFLDNELEICVAEHEAAEEIYEDLPRLIRGSLHLLLHLLLDDSVGVCVDDSYIVPKWLLELSIHTSLAE